MLNKKILKLSLVLAIVLLNGCGGPSPYQKEQARKAAQEKEDKRLEQIRVKKAKENMVIYTSKPDKAYKVMWTFTTNSSGQNLDSMKKDMIDGIKESAAEGKADAAYMEGGIKELPVKNINFKFSINAEVKMIKFTK